MIQNCADARAANRAGLFVSPGVGGRPYGVQSAPRRSQVYAVCASLTALRACARGRAVDGVRKGSKVRGFAHPTAAFPKFVSYQHTLILVLKEARAFLSA